MKEEELMKASYKELKDIERNNVPQNCERFLEILGQEVGEDGTMDFVLHQVAYLVVSETTMDKGLPYLLKYVRMHRKDLYEVIKVRVARLSKCVRDIEDKG